MEALNKNKAERHAADGMNPYGPMTNFGKHRNEVRHNEAFDQQEMTQRHCVSSVNRSVQ